MSLFTGTLRIPNMETNFYGGNFTSTGTLYGNYFPDFPLTESGGFGGIRKYHRGGRASDAIWGLTSKNDDFIRKEDPQSLTILHSATGYAADPVPLSDGRLLFAWARNPATGTEDIGQDYGLFIINPNNPSNPQLVYDIRGMTELRPQVLRARPLPPIINDTIVNTPSKTPVGSDSNISRDGTFTFDALNVYFNGPVDMNIVNAPTIGSATKIRFFTNYQRAPFNSDMSLNWPILLGQSPVPPSGAVRATAPANMSLFEDLRDASDRLPLLEFNGHGAGGAFVTGYNYGRPGSTARCVGCHAGHTQIPVPATSEEARWTNLAPGARVTASSTSTGYPERLVNRLARLEQTYDNWKSREGLANGQYVDLEFPVPVLVRTVRLYAARDGTIVRRATVRVYQDLAKTVLLGQQQVSDVSQSGTDVLFSDVTARAVRVTFDTVEGSRATLAEIEVIAAGQ